MNALVKVKNSYHAHTLYPLDLPPGTVFIDCDQDVVMRTDDVDYPVVTLDGILMSKTWRCVQEPITRIVSGTFIEDGVE